MGNFSGRVIAKHLFCAVYLCVYLNNKKTTLHLGKTVIKASFDLLDVIKHFFSARKRSSERNECTSFVAMLELYGDWRQA